MKSYTDLEQSKKLAKILPLESADMFWDMAEPEKRRKPIVGSPDEYLDMEDWSIPCWSLATLIDVLPVDWWGYNEHYFLEISKMGDASKPNEVRYFRFRKEIDGADYDRITHISHSAENLVDACVNMIITLHEHKLLSGYWTIRDAKKGDVLATNSGDICLFDGTVEDGKYPFAYCGIRGYGFEFYDRTLPFTHDYVHPATQKQSDLLFQKMKEVGYKWDINKKELIKL